MQTTIANVQFSTIKEKLEVVYKSSNLIHVSIHNRRNKILDVPSKIVGIYPKFLCVEAKVNMYLEKFTINFTDLITGNITIKEL